MSQPTSQPEPVINSVESLQEALHQLIPISRHMGIQVDAYTGNKLILTAPLSNNINHQLSAFGGSLFSIAALAGWGILQLKLEELGLKANTVIAAGEVSYSNAVFSDIRCVCELPADYDNFTEKLSRKGKASILLSPVVHTDSRDAMQLSGKYVVIQK